MKKRALSLALALVMCLGLAVPAMAAEENYFSKNGIPISQEPPTDAVSFDFVMCEGGGVPREEADYAIEDGTFHVLDCTTVPADKAGYQTTTLELCVEMFVRDNLTYCEWTSGIYDYYTGQQLRTGYLYMDGAVSKTTQLTYHGKTYAVDCTKANEWDVGEWYVDEEGTKYCDMICYTTLIVTAPADYDGMVFRLVNKTGAPTAGTDSDSDSDEVAYADNENNALCFRFGPKASGQPATPPESEQPTAGDNLQVSDWAKDKMAAAQTNNLVPAGLGSNYQVNITRAQFAAATVKLYEAMSGEQAPEVTENPFTDTSDPVTLQAASLGFVSGMGDGKFAPSAPVTREQMSVMLSSVYTRLGGEIPAVSATAFADDGAVSGWAKSAVAFMNGKEIISGMGENKYNPQGNATIEQALAVSLKMFQTLK